MLEYVESARAQGARIVAGGGRPEGLPEGNYLQATVIADVEPTMRTAKLSPMGRFTMPFSW